MGWTSWLIEACLLEAIARDALGDPAAAGRVLERALDLAEPDGTLLWFLLHPAPGLLQRQARQRTAHAALLARILDLLVPPGGHEGRASSGIVRIVRWPLILTTSRLVATARRSEESLP